MPLPDPHLALHAHFGFPAFRPGQEEAVRAAMAGRDVLVVMPTGAGKSLCYQLPALMRTDLTVVVSPLVSLMQDQVESLARRAPGRVALVNGQQEPEANAAAVAAAVAGEVRVLYVAPERFSAPGFAQALKPARVGLFVVDEAHCVSQWGHDFRPDYFRLADAARWLGASSIVASTATATPSVAADIVTRLGLRRPVRVATGFDRPNLGWVVMPSSAGAKEEQLIATLREPGATPAIVYAGTRRQVDELARTLTLALGRLVPGYHAGLGRGERAEAQRAFMAGEADVVVATNAFGMGVDKADVRTVVHAAVPPSVEAYYQEAGRAGRDGAPARAVLLAAPRDKGLHVFFIQRAEVTEEQVAQIAERIVAAAGGPPATGQPAPVFDVGVEELGGVGAADRVRAVVGALARAGVIQPAPSAVDRVCGRLLTPFDGRARAMCRTIAGDAQRARWRQYRAIWGFVESGRCRRATILRHFGDAPLAAAPGCCDVCDAAVVPVALAAVATGGTASGGRVPGGDAAPRRRGRRRDAGRTAVLTGTGVVELGGGSERTVAAAGLTTAICAALDAAGELSRARLLDVLRGGRTAALLRERHDGLPGYGTRPGLEAEALNAAVEGLLAAGRLVAVPGVFRRLRSAGAERVAA